METSRSYVYRRFHPVKHYTNIHPRDELIFVLYRNPFWDEGRRAMCVFENKIIQDISYTSYVFA